MSQHTKIFHRPTKRFSQTYQKCNFLATFHKFLQFCLSNSDVVSTTFGHFSQKSPLCRCGSYTHGSQRLMVSKEIIKNWGAKWGEKAENNLGGAFPPSCPSPPLAPPLQAGFLSQRRTPIRPPEYRSGLAISELPRFKQLEIMPRGISGSDADPRTLCQESFCGPTGCTVASVFQLEAGPCSTCHGCSSTGLVER